MNKKLFFLLLIVTSCRVMQADEPFAGWLTTETRYFRFYYEERDIEALGELLSCCDGVFETLTAFLDTKPPGKVDCIIRGRTDYANGFTSFIPPKIELFVASSTTPFLEGARTESWLEFVFIHELTHYIHLSCNKGIPGITGKLFGMPLGAQLTHTFLPGWAVEGITTNMETLYTAGGRGRNPFFEMFYKAPIIEKRLFSLDQAAYSSYFAPWGRIYVAGYIIVDYLLKEYGSDFFARAMNDYSWNLLGWFNGNVAHLATRDMELIYRNMQADLTLKYSAYFGIPGGTLVSPDQKGHWFLPRVTANGWYLYRESVDKGNALVRFDPATGSEVPLVRTYLADPFSYTAPEDGSVLVFSRIRSETGHQSGLKATADLYEYGLAGTGVRQITKDAHLWHPAFTKSGNRLIAVQRTGSYSRLVEVDRLTGEVKLLFAREKANVYNPVFSPSGTKIAFTMKVQGMQDIYLLDLERITPLAGTAFPANYNADYAEAVMGLDYAGEYLPEFKSENTLLFSSDRSSSLKLYALTLDTGTQSLAAEDPVGAWAGTWDGSRLIYASYGTNGFCLKSPAVPSNPVVLPDTSKEERYPALPATDNMLQAGKKWQPALKTVYWLPSLGVLDPAAAFTDYRGYGYGFSAIAGNVFGDTFLQNTLLYYPAYNQAEGFLSFTWNQGKFTTGCNLQQDFALLPETRQTTSESLSAGLLLYENAGLEYNTNLTLDAGITHQFIMQAANPGYAFGFMNLGNAPGITLSNYLSVTCGLAFNGSQNRPAADLYGLNTVKWRLDTRLDLPLFSRQATGSMLGTAFAWCLPLPGLHHNLKLGWKSGWQTAGGNFQYAAPRMNLLSAYTLESTSGDISCLADIEYLYSFPLVDFALLGIPFIGAGSAVHIEWPWQLNFTRGIANYQAIYAGAEITILTYYFPLGIGFNTRLNLANLSDFSLEGNFSFYIFIGFDSFMGG